MNKNMIKGVSGIVTLVGICASYAYGTKFEKNITVKKNYQRVGNSIEGPAHHIYMVSDSENNSYSVSKSLWYNQWNNNKLWNELEENSSHKIVGYGWRIPIFDVYPVIIRSDKISIDKVEE